MIRDFEIEQWKEWDAWAEQTPLDVGFMQASWWADFRATVGYQHFGALAYGRDGIAGGAVVQKYPHASGSSFYYVQDGPVLPRDDDDAQPVFAALQDAIDRRRATEEDTISHLRIEPRWAALPPFVTGFAKPPFEDSYVEPRNTLLVDLSPPDEAVLARMTAKARYNVRVALRHGVTVVEDTSEQGVERFAEIYEETADRQGIEAKPRDYFQCLVAILSLLRRIGIFFAVHDGERLAAAIVVTFGRTATYFYGGSTSRRRNVMAPYLLHFEIMKRAAAAGCRWYDLWGVEPHGASGHSWHDISVFKRRFGGVELALVPTLDLVYDKAAYRRYLEAERGEWSLSRAEVYGNAE
jgi:lipid II:glycine glycyltransferase (peptidoglycan interpeptide bridge formation enzyme)